MRHEGGNYQDVHFIASSAGCGALSTLQNLLEQNRIHTITAFTPCQFRTPGPQHHLQIISMLSEAAATLVSIFSFRHYAMLPR